MYILEVFTPVGMLLVRSSCVPGFGSFGADQCASSEGFLVTFTPGAREKSGLDFHFFLENSRNGFHFKMNQIEPTQTHPPGKVCGGENLDVGFFQKKPNQIVVLTAFTLGDGPVESRRGHLILISHLRGSREKVVFLSVMTPGPQGVLVASKPTDETALAPVETPNNKRDENKQELV
jgi:hypothetical protein